MTSDEQVMPRSIRCTKAEHRYLSLILKKLRNQNFDFSNGQPVAQDEPQKDPEPIIQRRAGISPNEFLKNHGLPPIEPVEPEKSQEPEETDLTQWRADPTMAEIDRGINYEMDSLGYPEIAETISRKFPSLWVKACKAKGKSATEYNEIMTELWEKINGK